MAEPTSSTFDWNKPVRGLTHVENGKLGLYVATNGWVMSAQDTPVSVLFDGQRTWYPETHSEVWAEAERLIGVFHKWRESVTDSKGKSNV